MFRVVTLAVDTSRWGEAVFAEGESQISVELDEGNAVFVLNDDSSSKAGAISRNELEELLGPLKPGVYTLQIELVRDASDPLNRAISSYTTAVARINKAVDEFNGVDLLQDDED